MSTQAWANISVGNLVRTIRLHVEWGWSAEVLRPRKERQGSLAAMHVQIILPCTYNLLCQQKCCRSSCQARQDKQSSTCVQQLPAWRVKVKCSRTASQERTQGESRECTQKGWFGIYVYASVSQYFCWQPSPNYPSACRVRVKCRSTASKKRTPGESGSYACANNSALHIQSVMPTEMLQK